MRSEVSTQIACLRTAAANKLVQNVVRATCKRLRHDRVSETWLRVSIRDTDSELLVKGINVFRIQSVELSLTHRISDHRWTQIAFGWSQSKSGILTPPTLYDAISKFVLVLPVQIMPDTYKDAIVEILKNNCDAVADIEVEVWDNAKLSELVHKLGLLGLFM